MKSILIAYHEINFRFENVTVILDTLSFCISLLEFRKLLSMHKSYINLMYSVKNMSLKYDVLILTLAGLPVQKLVQG